MTRQPAFFFGHGNPMNTLPGNPWVITGKNPGGHAIFDFIHRDPATYLPFLSTSETIPPRRTLSQRARTGARPACTAQRSCHGLRRRATPSTTAAAARNRLPHTAAPTRPRTKTTAAAVRSDARVGLTGSAIRRAAHQPPLRPAGATRWDRRAGRAGMRPAPFERPERSVV